MGFRARAAGQAVFVPTGRVVGKNSDNYDLVRAWAKSGTWGELLSHRATELFLSLIQTAPSVGGTVRAFRGRSLGPLPAPTSEQMGPPPAASSFNRYSLPGKAPLYVCETEEGVAREVRCKAGESVFVQRFVLPLESLNVADLTQFENGDLLNDAFFFAEIASDEANAHASLLFTQVLAELAADAGFGGIRVPGVRGDKLTRYFNVVVFAPDGWSEWLDQTWTPRPVANGNVA